MFCNESIKSVFELGLNRDLLPQPADCILIFTDRFEYHSTVEL